MSKLAVNQTLDKIKSLSEISQLLEEKKREGLKIIQCHGVFDLLHPGHIRHFQEAKMLGDCLVVTVTSDRFVNKGPGRPVFQEMLRVEAIAALEVVDFVVLNDSPDGTTVIEKIRPDFYVKGREYQNHEGDVTGKISEEVHAVESVGGKVHYTDDIVFSSSSLLNRYFDQNSPELISFIGQVKQQGSIEDLIAKIEGLKDLKVLVVGDAIIDEYQYTAPLGQSGKGLHMVARCLDKEVFLGGSLIIANHIAQFAKEVTLLTAVGKECPYLSFIRQHLELNVHPKFIYLEEMGTLTKKRYVLKDGKSLSKLFETYIGQENPLLQSQTDQVVDFINRESSNFDLILVADFGNGFTNCQIIDALGESSSFLALNAQINSGNRGYNVVTNYRRANYISINEPELRLSSHDRTSALEGIAADICQIMDCETISITRGVNGVLCYSKEGDLIEIPPFTTNTVDRIGAGDAYLSLSSLCLAKGYDPIFAGFIGSVAAAMSVQMVGNQEAIKKVPLCKFLMRLMK